MSIGIVGFGVLGNALYKVFKEKELPCLVYDKYKQLESKDGLKDLEKHKLLACDFIFLCLPTPYDSEIEDYNTESFQEWYHYLNQMEYQGIIVNKSTVMIGFNDQMAEKYQQLRIIHNPEFLTARTAVEDFRNQKHIVLGIPDNVGERSIRGAESRECQRPRQAERSGAQCQRSGAQVGIKTVRFYQNLFPEAKISLAKAKESESMKLFCNSFYAMKLQIFNEFYDLCQKVDGKMNYNLIKDMMLENGWINPMHTQVPGPDGKLSYGGGCFPKDTRALLSYMDRMASRRAMLQSCVLEREEMREKK